MYLWVFFTCLLFSVRGVPVQVMRICMHLLQFNRACSSQFCFATLTQKTTANRSGAILLCKGGFIAVKISSCGYALYSIVLPLNH